MAIPPNVFGETGLAIKRTALQLPSKGWSRLVIEKPFGMDAPVVVDGVDAADHVRDAKCKVLRSIPEIELAATASDVSTKKIRVYRDTFVIAYNQLVKKALSKHRPPDRRTIRVTDMK